MTQMKLPMLTYYEGPRLVSPAVLEGLVTYRDAVRMCWNLRTRAALTRRQLAEEAGLYGSHVSDYLSTEACKRELPAKHITEFEIACGNLVITQWLARRAQVTILEQFMEQRAVGGR